MPTKKATNAVTNAATNAATNAKPHNAKSKPKPKPMPERNRLVSTEELRECKKTAHGAWRNACETNPECTEGLRGACGKDLGALPQGIDWQNMWGHKSADPVESRTVRKAQRCVLNYTWDNPTSDFGDYYKKACKDQIDRAVAKSPKPKTGGAAKKKKPKATPAKPTKPTAKAKLTKKKK
jgi:hypothetical protein